jgi:hypothetical protein
VVTSSQQPVSTFTTLIQHEDSDSLSSIYSESSWGNLVDRTHPSDEITSALELGPHRVVKVPLDHVVPMRNNGETTIYVYSGPWPVWRSDNKI